MHKITKETSLENEVKALRSFAKVILERDRSEDITGDELQEIAIEYGLLEMYTPREPCCENCACAEVNSAGNFYDGDVFCYKIIDSIKQA